MSAVVKSRMVTITSILLGIGVVLGALVLTAAVLLQNTLYSTRFYEKATTSVNYIPMLKLAITGDLYGQSSYVAIPIENLTAGLVDAQLKEALKSHVQNVVDFMTFKADYAKSTYPEDLFYAPLEVFIKSDGAAGGYIPSKEQYTLLHAVAKDSTEIVAKHVNILNMDLVKNESAFKKLQRLLFTVRGLLWPAAGLLLASLALLLALHRKSISRAVLFGASSLWIFGTLLLVPSVVLEVFGITRRLAIQTVYLKYAMDTWLTQANRLAMGIGLVVFLCTAGVLVARILVRKKRT